MKLEDIVRKFFAEIGAEPVACDAEGVYRFEANGTQVSFLEDDGLVRFIAPVGPVPKEGRERFCRELLTAMFPSETADGNVLSLQPGEDVVCLHRKDSLEGMELSGFCETFGAFTEALGKWREMLAAYRPEGDSKAGTFMRV